MKKHAKKTDELIKKIAEHKGIKPRLTFLFPLDKTRHEAVEVLSGKRKPDAKLVTNLIKSNDIFEKMIGLYLLPHTDINPSDAIKHIEEAIKSNDVRLKAVAAGILRYYGRDALPYIEKLENDKEEDVSVIATGSKIKLLKKEYGKKAIPKILDILDKSGHYRLISDELADDIIEYGKGSFEYLKRIIENGEGDIRFRAAEEMVNHGERGYKYLVNMAKGNDSWLKATAAWGLSGYGKKAVPYLKELAMDIDPFVSAVAIRSLGEIGGKDVFEYLVGISKKHPSTLVKGKLAKALKRYGKKGLPFIEDITKEPDLLSDAEEARVDLVRELYGEEGVEKLLKDKNPDVKKAAEDALFSDRYYENLIWNRKPLFATPYTEELISRIERLQEISSTLKKEFGNDFIGITVFGSTSKGYMRPSSDLDYAVIANNKKVLKRFKELAKDLDLCEEHYVNPKEYNRLKNEGRIDEVAPLFYGIFFGDNNKLAQLQYDILNKLTKGDWERIRNEIYSNEISLEKAEPLFNVNNLKPAAALLRVPPTRDKTLEILRKRVKRKRH